MHARDSIAPLFQRCIFLTMLEHLPGTVDKQTPSSTLAPSRTCFAFALATAMFLPGHAQSTHLQDTSPWNNTAPTAPDLSRIPPNTDLLGKPFRIAENGPEACLCIEKDKLILRLNGEEFIVQKICTIDGVAIDLTPACVATCRTVATLKSHGDGVIGRITIPLLPALEQHMGSKQMLTIAQEIREGKQVHHPRDSFLVTWKDVYGKHQGTATLERKPRVPSLALR